MVHPVEYSVIVPVFNSEQSLLELFGRIKATFDSIAQSFEVIFVEDCGTDQSWEVLLSIKEQNPELVTIIKLAKNFGQHSALFCGFHYAKGNFIITLDDDLQIPPEEIIKLIQRYDETQADLVYGDLIKKEHSFIRNQGSKILKKSSKKLDKDAPGKGSSFKLITKALYNKILIHNQSFVYIDELLLWYTRDIAFADVIHVPRKYQQSTYTFLKLFRLFVNITIHYTVVPLKFMTVGGLVLSTISFLFGMTFVFKKIFFNVPLGYTSLIVAILFSSSIILFSLGIIGEYLNRIFQVQNKKPEYSIKKIL